MDITNGEIASRIINDLNALQKDTHISRRYVIGIANQKAMSYIAQRWADGTLFGEESLFSRITCFEMEEVDRIECPFVELRNCRILMRSRQTLPRMPYSRYGAAILSVTSIDDRTLFTPSSLSLSTLNKGREFGHIKRNMYYVSDGSLYIPDVHVEAVNIVLLAMDKREADGKQGCGVCNTCKSYWDYDFVCPEKLREYVISETVQEIAGIRMRVPTDENPDLDSNQRGKKSL
jgi:hypothetical protein